MATGTPTAIDRREASTALAKVIAYRAVGKHDQADEWAERLAALVAR